MLLLINFFVFIISFDSFAFFLYFFAILDFPICLQFLYFWLNPFHFKFILWGFLFCHLNFYIKIRRRFFPCWFLRVVFLSYWIDFLMIILLSQEALKFFLIIHVYHLILKSHLSISYFTQISSYLCSISLALIQFLFWQLFMLVTNCHEFFKFLLYFFIWYLNFVKIFS